MTVALAGVVPPGGGSAQHNPARSPSCLHLGRIDRTEVVETTTETCILGDFELVDTADVEALKAAAKAAKAGTKE